MAQIVAASPPLRVLPHEGAPPSFSANVDPPVELVASPATVSMVRKSHKHRPSEGGERGTVDATAAGRRRPRASPLVTRRTLSEEEIVRLRALEAKQAVAELLYRYCKGVELRDAEMISSVFHPDGLAEYPRFRASGAEIGPLLARTIASECAASRILITNLLVDVDGDQARSESSFLISRVVHDGNRYALQQAIGTYADEIRRRDGSWRIIHRRASTAWAWRTPSSDVLSVTALPPFEDQISRPV